MANVFINSILWFLKLKLTILCRVESTFESRKFDKPGGGGVAIGHLRVLVRRKKLKFIKIIEDEYEALIA